MLVLYHGGPGANSLKVLLALKEKGLDFVSHLLNLHAFEQHSPEFLKINPNGQVPVLVHDGRIITESTVINEYLDEVFPEVPLRPADAYGRARMRIWTKFVDEYFCPALSFLGWHAMIRDVVRHLSPEELEEKIRRIPLKEQQDKWREAAAQTWTEEQLAEWRRKVRFSIQKMEQGLEGPWMLGNQYTLADVSMFSMVNHMPQRYSDILNERDSPRVLEWYARMIERPGVKAALAMPRPQAAPDAQRSKTQSASA